MSLELNILSLFSSFAWSLKFTQKSHLGPSSANWASWLRNKAQNCMKPAKTRKLRAWWQIFFCLMFFHFPSLLFFRLLSNRLVTWLFEILLSKTVFTRTPDWQQNIQHKNDSDSSLKIRTKNGDGSKLGGAGGGLAYFRWWWCSKRAPSCFFLFSLMSELIVLLTNIYSVWLVLIVI